jgi:2-oxoglutarate dehydrogenase E1 component
VFDNIFETVNSGFAQALYEEYLRDPAAVPEEWRKLFASGLRGEPPATVGGGPEHDDAPVAAHPIQTVTTSVPIQGPALRLLQNMEDSLAIPTATSFRDVDVALLWEMRAKYNDALKAQGIKLSFTHLVGWAVVRASQALPTLGHTVVEHDGSPHRVESATINLGLAVDTEGRDGRRKLMVPVIKGADHMGFREFYEEYERLVAGARDGSLMPDAYMGGTITLTNPGTIGTVASVPRLMRGQGSIIATGAIRRLADLKLMTISCTYDHRIIQGAESGMFLRTVDLLLQGDDGFYSDVAAAMQIVIPDSFVEPGEEFGQSPRAIPAAKAHTGLLDELVPQVAAAMSLVGAYRTHGYLAAQLDPLGTEPIGDPALQPKSTGLTPEIMAQIPADVLGVFAQGNTLADVLPKLQRTYCGTIAYEIEHIASHEERDWLRQLIESGQHRHSLSSEEKRRTLLSLIRAATFEEFLHRTYLGQKRFGIEGLEALIPMLEAAIEMAGDVGAREVVMGMAHRGRLNVLTHILGVRYETILSEFEGGRDIHDTLATGTGTGDVKYHYGASGVFETALGAKLDVILMPNPSHLEAVNPVVEGHVRASQTDRSGRSIRHHPRRVIPILMHGDAAFAGQGVVAETLNLACLEGYDTGGTLHIITNNQIGFTTTSAEARSTDFASDLAKGFDIPIVHVNADDAEACIAAVRLAMMYRKMFHDDCVINLVGYRRYGHNESDEPRYTQPLMYARIDSQLPVAESYARSLTEQGVVTADEIAQERDLVYHELAQAHARIKNEAGRPVGMQPISVNGDECATPEPDTKVDRELLRDLNGQLLRQPDSFTVNSKLRRQLDRREKVFDTDGAIDWAHAEILAIGSLLAEGIPVRLVGQDTARGTFSQRHLTLHDADTGDRYTPIQNLRNATAPLELHNTPLSEYGALGFEYGYSVAAPETLVMWEAQFGDFANTAEVIIDQFIIAGLAKWAQTSRLVLLLPHGYEGQGPEHSSARLERYLALGTECNIRVANCSTPAQYFHLLRRQAKHLQLRPLVLMTPKSLLRHPSAVSRLGDLAEGRFQHVLDDPTLPALRGDVDRIVLCSGKVYYDTIGSPLRAEANNVAIARIELLYPFPEDAISALIALYPKVREIVWLQEEPANMGARKWVMPQLAELVPEWTTTSHVARPERSSPAEGYLIKHREEQARLVAKVLGPAARVKKGA